MSRHSFVRALRLMAPLVIVPLVMAPLVMAGVLAVATAAGAASEKKKGGGESFVQLPTIAATILRADHSRGVMTVEVGVDVRDGALRKRAEQSVPLLRDAFLREMLTYAPTIPAGAPPNPDVISAQLQHAADATLGRPGAKVLLGTVLVN